MKCGEKADYCFLHNTAYILVRGVVPKNTSDKVCPT